MKLKPTGAETHISTSSTSFDQLREQADRERRQRRAEPIVQDGNYGFDSQQSGFHSDKIMAGAPAQGHRRWQR